MPNEQETPAGSPHRTPHVVPNDAPLLLDGKPAGTCRGCGAVTDWYRGHGVWLCVPCWETPSPDGLSAAPTSRDEFRIIPSDSHTGGQVDWVGGTTQTIATSPNLTCARCGAKTTSLVNGACWACRYNPSRYKGPDGIYRCPECGCGEAEIHTGPCLERRLEEKAKQGICEALADLRSHGADMRVRISRLRWLPKYAAKVESAPTKVRTRMTFRDFIHKIADAIFNFFN